MERAYTRLGLRCAASRNDPTTILRHLSVPVGHSRQSVGISPSTSQKAAYCASVASRLGRRFGPSCVGWMRHRPDQRVPPTGPTSRASRAAESAEAAASTLNDPLRDCPEHEPQQPSHILTSAATLRHGSQRVGGVGGHLCACAPTVLRCGKLSVGRARRFLLRRTARVTSA